MSIMVARYFSYAFQPIFQGIPVFLGTVEKSALNKLMRQ
jgi:hypothetical protein